MILDLLERAGLTGEVAGTYLQGGVGELAAEAHAKVRVPEAQAADAQAVIAEWEATQPLPDKTPARQSRGGELAIGFILGGLAGALVLTALNTSPSGSLRY